MTFSDMIFQFIKTSKVEQSFKKVHTLFEISKVQSFYSDECYWFQLGREGHQLLKVFNCGKSQV